MIQTVAEVLTAGMDSVTIINEVKDGTHNVTGMTQAEINEMIQRNVDHLELILAYTDPDVAGSADDKTSYTTAITVGKQYITDNS